MGRVVLLFTFALISSAAAPRATAHGEGEDRGVLGQDRIPIRQVRVQTQWQTAHDSFGGSAGSRWALCQIIDHSSHFAHCDRWFRSDCNGGFRSSASLKVKREYGHSESHAGLQIAGGYAFARVELHHSYGLEKLYRAAWFHVSTGSTGEAALIEDADPSKPLLLRITRKKDVVMMAHSFDGKKWEESPVPARYRPLALPDEVKVSLFLAHTTYEVLDATFTDFNIKKLE